MKHPQRAPGALPLIGHALSLIRDPWSFLTSLPRSGDLVEIGLGPWRAYVVCSPELTRQVLLDDRTYDKGGPMMETVRQVVGNGLGSCPHGQHRRQRRLNQPAFHSQRMPTYAAEMTAQVAATADSWHEDESVDVVATMEKCITRALIATMFVGFSFTEDELDEMLHDALAISRGVVRGMLMPPALAALPYIGNRKFDKARDRIRRVVSRGIKNYRSNPADRGDLLSMLVAAQDVGDNGDRIQPRLSDQELIDTTTTYLIGGSDTTASLVSWALYLIALHPDVERELHAEVDSVLAGGPAIFGHLPRLEVTSRIITETLRHRPPAWIFTRFTTRDTDLGGYHLPAGTTLVYSQYIIHHRPDVYPDPEWFNPDRWLDDSSKSFPRGALIAFGAGARKCIGDTFAITQSCLTLATIAARWKMELAPGSRVRSGTGIILRPEGLHMLPVARNRARR
ncbi:cytochrome P450 [Allokutzneria sp. NRRL B-24872]|uniref:cytochrome P450 n=1 Tax=Allokutzneria sp. NRRL B-24872 TaxID=1137961 RepID=UPI000A3B25A5|nr:cytochrome P450 [Allokutzneria sp. NRRL B-24872]